MTYQKYLNALAIIQHVGKPDLFITFTCDPQWIEITGNIRRSKGQTAFNRMDCTARIFNAKLRRFMHMVVKQHVFGHVKGYAYSIEFQKRGLSHAHILLILEHNYLTHLFLFGVSQDVNPLSTPSPTL